MTVDFNHLLVTPILLPLATAALMLLLGEGRRGLKAVVNVLSTTLGLAVAVCHHFSKGIGEHSKSKVSNWEGFIKKNPGRKL